MECFWQYISLAILKCLLAKKKNDRFCKRSKDIAKYCFIQNLYYRLRTFDMTTFKFFIKVNMKPKLLSVLMYCAFLCK